MAALSLHLSDEMAQKSQELAKQLGISRTQFIRIAIQHELKRTERQLELDDMASALRVMEGDTHYRATELNTFDDDFDDTLEDEDDAWWTRK